jgi:plasmid stability protein
MAKKGEARKPGSRDPDKKAVRLDLDPEEQVALRVLAAKHGMSMAAYARQLVQEAIARDRTGQKM